MNIDAVGSQARAGHLHGHVLSAMFHLRFSATSVPCGITSVSFWGLSLRPLIFSGNIGTSTSHMLMNVSHLNAAMYIEHKSRWWQRAFIFKLPVLALGEC